jgi:hypothetical protein
MENSGNVYDMSGRNNDFILASGEGLAEMCAGSPPAVKITLTPPFLKGAWGI